MKRRRFISSKCSYTSSHCSNSTPPGRLIHLQLATLPERISYSTVKIESPLGRIAHIPRREIFDVRLQLLQEDGNSSDQVIDQLENSDLRAGVYEGGFKTWECSIDLASLLLDRGPRKDIDELVQCDQVVEVQALQNSCC